MAEGLGRERWAHTSLICTLIANAHRDPKKRRPFTPDDFNPYTGRHHRQVAGKPDLTLLRETLEARPRNQTRPPQPKGN
ncbi:MAG: hypothetical protein GC159_11545 [Phycisphaera sp.]|nr:hypothetical protein [Phycisphaera sp.]